MEPAAAEQQLFRNADELVLQVNGDTNEPLAAPDNAVPRKLMRKKNLWHRASYVFVETVDGKFIVQKRSATKEYCPSYFALATGGVMAPDETNELNAQRELEEEIGVTRTIEQLKLLGQSRFSNDYTQCWGNVFYVKMIESDPELKLQVEEVAGVEYWTKDEIQQLIADQEEKGEANVDKKITPDGILAFRELLKHL